MNKFPEVFVSRIITTRDCPWAVNVLVPTPEGEHGVTSRVVARFAEKEDAEAYLGVVMENEPILQFFAYEHLPSHLQEVSRPFHAMAYHLVEKLPRNPERTVALRKLLESKDAAVRAMLFKEQGQGGG